ncbi:MAG: serine/threonine protein kinase [Rubripirellula sp.]
MPSEPPPTLPALSRASNDARSGDFVNGARDDEPVDSLRMTPRRLAIIAAVLLLLALGFGVALRGSLRQLAGDALQGVLVGNTTSVESWMGQRLADAEQLQQQTATLEEASMLIMAESPADAGSLPLSDLSLPAEYAGWCLVTPDGTVAATDLPHLLQRDLPVPEDAWKTLVGRQPVVCLPFPAPLNQAAESDRYPVAWMAAMVPIVDGARTIGALMMMLDPNDTFIPLVTTTRVGATGQSYAFDSVALFVTPVRFRNVNRRARRPKSPTNGMLQESARLPIATKSDEALKQAPSALPLTFMADQATRGGTGQDLDGYTDFRGEEVIGAWTWLPEYKLGLATETSVREAYESLDWLKWLTMANLLAIAGMAYYSHRVSTAPAVEVGSDGTNVTRRIGPYDLGSLVGEGGMGAVYRAKHRLLGREVAIKVLQGEEVNPISVSRFEREVQTTSRLRHPNTIEIYDYGVIGTETYYYAMEFVDGITLQELIENFGPQPPERVIHLLLQICGSLSEAHQSGMIHRDIKPSNILLTARAGLYDMIKVLDFGLVREVDRESADLTQSEGITGTPMYMSPESVRDATKADEQSDLYSTGAVGYTLLTGMPTFEGDSSVDVCLKQLNEEPIRPSDRLGASLPDDLQNLLMSCLRKEPKERPHTMEEFESSLRQCTDAGRWTSADAIRWWEIEFQAGMGQDSGKSSGAGTNRLVPADPNERSAGTGDSGTTTVH